MKKKTRIIGSISALAISMAMLTGGVLAASSVSLNVSSTVTFQASGIYLKVDGQVKRGTEGSLTDLLESERPTGEQSDDTLSYTYLDYSYDEDVDGTPIGGASFENMPEWKIGTVNFTENANVIQYEMEFTNYSEQMIDVVITPTVQNTLVNVAASSTGATTLTLSSNQTQTYTFNLTLDSFAQSTSGSVSFDVDAGPSSAVLAEITNKNNFSYINLTVNGLYPSDPILVKEGDALLIWSSDINFGISLTLYNSEDTSINNWLELTPGGSLRVTVPELQEGYYFKFLLLLL